MSFDDDEALFEDIYGDDETQVSETTKAEEAKTEAEPAAKSETPAAEATTGTATPNANQESTTTDAKGSEDSSANQTSQQQQPPQQPPQQPYGQQQYGQQPPQQQQQYQQAPAPPQQMPPSNLGKDHGKMFIGGLNWDTTEEGLKTYFSKFGEVVDFTIMRDNATGKSRGFGFLTFADPKSVDEVIKTDHVLDGKLIDPKRAIARDEQDKVGKIFVGGIDPMVNEQDFNEFFSQFGSIVDAQLMIDKDTGRSRGFGFITYDSPEAVDRVCVNKYLSLKGKAMEVKRAEPRGQHQQNQQQQQQPYNYGNQYGQMQYGARGQQQTPQQYGANGMSPEMMQEYWQRMQQWYMYQQQAAAAGGNGQGEDEDGEKPQEPLNPQQQSQEQPPLPPPPPPQGGSNSYGRDKDNGYQNGPKRYPPSGPRGAPPSGPGGYRGRGRGRGGYQGRGGYGRGGYQGRGGYHPYNKR